MGARPPTPLPTGGGQSKERWLRWGQWGRPKPPPAPQQSQGGASSPQAQGWGTRARHPRGLCRLGALAQGAGGNRLRWGPDLGKRVLACAGGLRAVSLAPGTWGGCLCSCHPPP